MRKNKRLLSVLLSLIMAFGLLPASLITADALVEYDLWVGGKRVTSENAGNIFGDNSARYDHATQTLTLQNPKLTGMYNYALIYSENKLKVVGSLASQSYVTEYGIFVNMGSLEFNKMNSTDNGSLSFNGKRTGVYAGGDITILDKHVYAYGEAGTGIYSKTGNIYIDAQDKQIVANGGAHGLCCSGSVTIADVGALNANASAVEGVGINAMSGSVRIGSGCKGEISASGERAGVWAKKDFVMHGGKIEIVCTRTKEKSRTDYGYGVFCKDGDLTVDGGSFKATGGYAATSAQNFTIKNCTFYTSLAWIGISNFGDLTIEKADVTSKGYAWGVSMSGNLTLNAGSEVFAMCEEDIALKVLGSVTIDPSLAINEPEDGKLVGSKFLNKNDQEAKLVRIGKPIEKYDIWIGADQITELNKNDFFGDGSVALDTTTTPYTLTLNDPAIPGEWADSKIFIDGIDVAIKGKATLEGSEYAINSDSSGSIDLYGDFNLKGKTVGLFCAGNLAIEEGTIVVEGGKDGIYVVSDCVIDGDDVTATGSEAGIYLEAGNLKINGAKVTAKNVTERAIYVDDGSFRIENHAELNAEGGESGIFATKDIDLIDSTVNAKGVSDAAIYSNSGNINVKSCTVVAESESLIGIQCPDGVYTNDTDANVKVTAAEEGVLAGSVRMNGGVLEVTSSGKTAVLTKINGILMLGGELTATGANGIVAEDGDVNISGGKVVATANSEEEESYAICAADDTIILCTANVQAKSNGHGIYANKNVEIDTSTISSQAVKGYALASRKDMIMEGGTAVLLSNENDAVHVAGNLMLDQSVSLTAQGGKYGIYAGEELNVVKASVNADGPDNAVYSENGKFFREPTLYLTEPMNGKVSADNKTIVTLYEEKATSVKIRMEGLSFGVFVGSAEITMDNMNDVFGDMSVVFDPADYTLRFLNNVEIAGDHNGAKIYAKDVDLTIAGNEDILDDTASYGVYVENGSVTFDGFFKIKSSDAAVYADKDIIVQSGSVEAEGGNKGLVAKEDITIVNASVDAKGNDAISADEEIYMSNVSVNAEGSNGFGIFSLNGNIVITDVSLVRVKGTNAGIKTAAGDVAIDVNSNVEADGGENKAFDAAGAITLDDTQAITEPEGAKIDGGTVTQADGTGFAVKAKIEPKPITCVVLFDSKGGTTVEDQIVVLGATAEKPAEDPTRTGFTFDGWYADEEYTTDFPFDDPIMSDTVVYAKWTEIVAPPANYTVSFDVDGGSEVAAQTVEDGKTAEKPEDPTKEGYDFSGWFTDNTFAVGFDFALPITADTTVYAKWTKHEEIKKYSVVFHVDGGSEVASQIVTEGGLIEKPEDPTREGYTFKGWFTDDTFATGFDFTAPVTADVMIYAKWTKDEAPEAPKYTVTFISNGGSDVEAQTVEEGDLAVRPAEPTREEYTFKGWFEDEELTTEYTFLTAVTADVTVYAKWEKNEAPGETIYTVTFNTDGGAEIAAQTVKEGEKAEKPADPTKEGFTFKGWFADAEL
ncbi:MAG: InlB B-repeat-containing protein, partial [Clostridia bacterium]|nr:InlB B-repeat-containing protein [Clostridia bacterium]